MTLRIAILVLAASAWGCSSIRSTLIHRNETNTGWEKERLLCGVPVTVKMPTHLKVTILEHHYLADTTPPNFVELDVPLRSVVTDLIHTDKIFTVDPKRPAAGTLNATMTFEGQYPKTIDYKVVDKTIQDITTLIQTVAKKGLLPAPQGIRTEGDVRLKGGSQFDNLTRVDSVAATAVFDLEAPDLELQVARFLTQHLNGCHTCQIVPPGVEQPQRLPRLLDDPCPRGTDGVYCPTCLPGAAGFGRT